MKLIRKGEGQHRFQLTPREKDLLLNVLQLYPRVPSGYQPLTRSTGREEDKQRLLDEALTETRLENQKELQRLLSDAQRLRQQEGQWQLTLAPVDLEWLLQVLNDIRIGSWIHLGSPATPLKALTAQTAPDLWAMEMAGSFQMRFLELLEG